MTDTYEHSSDAKDDTMNQKEIELSEKIFRANYEQLGKQEKHVAHHLAERTHIARNVAQDFFDQLTFGQRLADKVATFGGSWTFISIFAVVLVIWVFLNSFILIRSDIFDPYPYILLNLFLSTIMHGSIEIRLWAAPSGILKRRYL